MQTVQVQCGKCGKLMAVTTAHLGGQVRCPHCLEVVQVPAAAPADEAAADTLLAPLPEVKAPEEAGERESIFGTTEDIQSDDLFGAAPGPLVEMPAADVAAPTEAVAPSLSANSLSALSGNSATITRPRESEAHATPDELPAPDIAARARTSSMLVPMLLIFLIPYAIVCTAYIAWTLLDPPHSFDPLERLPDTKPGEGGPRRVDPHTPLPRKLKTSLQKPIHVGHLEVTPLKVELAGGDLVLQLKMVNTSNDLAFSPMHDSFAFHNDKLKGRLPYTYLQMGNTRIYGGLLDWHSKPHDDDDAALGNASAARKVIGPGQEIFISLTTPQSARNQVQALMRSRERILWRVQVRRGFVKVHDRDVSATAIIGVEFTPQTVEKRQAAS
jgi:hypothetical protein